MSCMRERVLRNVEAKCRGEVLRRGVEARCRDEVLRQGVQVLTVTWVHLHRCLSRRL
jgi:hypothetical protein